MPERKKTKAPSGAGREARPPRTKSAPRKPRPSGKAAAASPAAAARPRAEETAAIVPRASAGAAPPGTITILQVGSGIGCPIRHKRVLRALGLRHPHHRVVRPDNPAVRGMVAAVPHLARIVEDGHGA